MGHDPLARAGLGLKGPAAEIRRGLPLDGVVDAAPLPRAIDATLVRTVVGAALPGRLRMGH
eukprot:2808053-Lingulodinium_polyedra.AAC.1